MLEKQYLWNFPCSSQRGALKILLLPKLGWVYLIFVGSWSYICWTLISYLLEVDIIFVRSLSHICWKLIPYLLEVDLIFVGSWSHICWLLGTLSDFHCVGVSKPSRSVRGPRDVIYIISKVYFCKVYPASKLCEFFQAVFSYRLYCMLQQRWLSWRRWRWWLCSCS